MLPIKCSQPPCKNIELNKGKTFSLNENNCGHSVYRTGTMPALSIKFSRSGPSFNSWKNTTRLITINARVTTGKRRDGMLSRRGSMGDGKVTSLHRYILTKGFGARCNAVTV